MSRISRRRVCLLQVLREVVCGSVPWLGVAAAAFLCFRGTARAQTAGDVTYVVHGRVLSGATGVPLARALVVSGDRRLGTMTDSEGQFVLNVVVPAESRQVRGLAISGSGFPGAVGSLILLAQKPGFLADNTFTSLPIDDKLNSTEVDLKLMPGAVVEGRVFAEGTGAAANVRVALLRHEAVDGRRVWQVVSNAPTDSRGNFHFGTLRPGEYAAMTAEWRGEQILPREHADSTQGTRPCFWATAPTSPPPRSCTCGPVRRCRPRSTCAAPHFSMPWSRSRYPVCGQA